MKAGIKFSDIKVCEDNKLICDGHHRYLASLLANAPIGKNTSFTKSDITEWKSIVFEEDEWDNPEELHVINQQDAAYNNIKLDKIMKLLEEGVALN